MPSPRASPSIASSLRRNTLALVAFWLLVGALLYGGFKWMEQRRNAALQPYADSAGSLTIPRGPNGHFRVDGEVNHHPVSFLIDTGASAVAITESAARGAALPAGRPVTLQTASGISPGELVRGVPVRVGTLALNDTTVMVGLVSGRPDDALLGQSFLRRFDVQISADRMRISTPGR